MNRHALQALEFHRVLEIVSGHASGALGAEAVRERLPSADADAVSAELDRVDEMTGWLIRDESWAPPNVPDIRRPLERLELEGSVWSEAELGGALRLLSAARTVRRAILPHSADYERLAALAEGLLKHEKLQERLERALDVEAETIRDGATPKLKRLRSDARAARSDLVQHLESLMGNLPDRIAVPNASVTVRNGRYCIAIRREGRSEIGGIVHDESASHATLFVEPPSAIELMNRLRELELAEAREVERIRRELTDALRPHRTELQDTLERLVALDSVFARARYALIHGCARPRLVERASEGYRVVNGRHPLLLEGDEPVVPFDLLLNPGEHTVLVTGPNSGGKTVLLKAVGLFTTMTQAGLLPPVGQGSEIPVFRDVFADIGDEQSIEASLSTFTAHLGNLNEILQSADADSLCLIDEIGGATDPQEGSALARAVLVELTGRGAMTLATSHLGTLKTMASDVPGIVNAGLSFDPEELEPLYRLIKGRPGRSYGLAIARRIRFPGDVLDAAEAALDGPEADTSRLLEQLEKQEDQLAERIDRLERREQNLAEREQELEEREDQLQQQREELERDAHRQAREYLLEARKEVDRAIAADREEEARSARKEIEARLREHSDALDTATDDDARRGAPSDFEPGEPVRVTSLDRDGRVVEVRDGDVVVEVGGVKLHAAPADLERRPEPEEPEERVTAYGGTGPEPEPEIDLRGLIADEARMELLRSLDAAVQAGLPSLTVIHGKGTGVLRQTVAECVQSDKRVRSYRLGAAHEGGTGVTIVELE